MKTTRDSTQHPNEMTKNAVHQGVSGWSDYMTYLTTSSVSNTANITSPIRHSALYSKLLKQQCKSCLHVFGSAEIGLKIESSST